MTLTDEAQTNDNSNHKQNNEIDGQVNGPSKKPSQYCYIYSNATLKAGTFYKKTFQTSNASFRGRSVEHCLYPTI